MVEQELRDLYRAEYLARYPDSPDRRLLRLSSRFDLRGDESVVDLACGNGLLLDLLHDRVGSYLGVDFSSEFIEAATERARRLGWSKGAFVCSDIEEYLDRRTAGFDVAFALDFVEHIHDPDCLRIFRAVRRSLKPSGILYLHTPDGAFLLERLKARGVLRQLPEHVAVRTRDEVVAILAACGFGRVMAHALSHYHPLLRLLHPLSRIPLVGDSLRARLFVEARP